MLYIKTYIFQNLIIPLFTLLMEEVPHFKDKEKKIFVYKEILIDLSPPSNIISKKISIKTCWDFFYDL